jgi:glycosyltransferase involved in cell wall biosynthesis
MKVIQIMAGNEEGGLENHFVALCNALVKHVDVIVVAHKKYEKRFNKKVVFIPLDLSKSRRNIRILLKLVHIIRKMSPDIVHAHADKAVSMVGTLRYWFPKRTRCIATLHSEKKHLNKYKKCDFIIGVSQKVVKYIDTIPTKVIYNGIKEIRKKKIFNMEQWKIDTSVFKICAIGRLEKVKGFDTIIRAVSNMENTVLLIAGEGTQENALKNLVKELKCEDKVKFIGFCKDIFSLLGICDVVAFGSKKEGLSYVLVEALLCRVPVVGTDVSDFRMILPQEAIVPYNDNIAMQKALEFIQSETKENTQKRYAKSYAFAYDHFQFDMMLQDILDVYNMVNKRECIDN